MGWRWLWWCFACSAALFSHLFFPRNMRSSPVFSAFARFAEIISCPAPPKPSCMRPTIFAKAMRTFSVSYLLLLCPSSWSVGFSARRLTNPTIDSIGWTTITVTSVESSTYLHKRVVVWRGESGGGWSERVERAQLHVHCKDDDDED